MILNILLSFRKIAGPFNVVRQLPQHPGQHASLLSYLGWRLYERGKQVETGTEHIYSLIVREPKYSSQ